MNKQYDKTFVWLAVLAALLVGFFSILPQLLIQNYITEHGGSYLYKNLFSFNDEVKIYTQLAHEVYEGHYPSAELSLDKPKATFFPMLPSVIASSFMLLFGGNVNAAYLALNFLFNAAAFMAAFMIGKYLIKTKDIWSFLFGFIASLTPALLYLPKAFYSLSNFKNIVLTSFYPAVRTVIDRSFLSKVDDPLITIPFFLFAILAFYAFWERPRFLTSIIAGITNGIMIHVYFFPWVYLVTTIGLLFIYSALRRRQEPERFRYFVVLIGVMVFLFIPYLINYLKFTSLESHRESILRYAEVIYDHQFGWKLSHSRAGIKVYKEYIFYAVLASLTYLALRKRWWQRDKFVFYFAAILAMFAVWNIQVITGFVPEQFHWLTTVSPMILVIVYDLTQSFINKFRLLIRRAGAVIITILIVLLITKKAVNASKFIEPPQKFITSYSFNADLLDSWKWMNARLPKDSRVISPSFKTTLYLNTYTGARPYLPVYLTTLMTTKEFENRFAAANKIFRIPENIYSARVRQDESVFRSYWEGIMNGLYGNTFLNEYYNRKQPATEPFINKPPAAKTQELIDLYRIASPTWKNTGADYAYYGLYEKELGARDLEGDPDLTLVYENPTVKIYQIKK